MHHFTLISEVALGLWVPLSIACFLLMRPPVAALVVVLGGDMFLPELTEFKFPFLPQFDKHNIPYLCVVIGCLLRSPSRLTKAPKEPWFLLLTFALFAGATLTGLTNADPVIRKWMPPLSGLTIKDGFYVGALNLTRVSLPFFVGCAFFRTAQDFRRLLVGLAIAAVVYAPLTLFEVRMSPQLHSWVYGYFQHSFDQTRRWGGFRPTVFMSHGLSLARFFMVAIFAAFALGRAKRPLLAMPAQVVGWGLVVVLILCKSTAAIVLSMAAIPLLLWGSPRIQARVAVLFAAFVFFYPMLRTLDLVPTEQILQTSNSLVGSERTGSVEFRFKNENILLERARQRILFGWGQYQRNFVFDRWGKPAIPDGYWVIQLGTIGVVGFIASFGTFLIPIYLARRRLKFISIEADRKMIAGTALVLGAVALDWVANGLWAPYPYMIAGALAGVTRTLASESSAPTQAGVHEWTPPEEVT